MAAKLGHVAGRTAAAGPEEVELLRLGRCFSEEEKKKAVKWFVAHGKPLPTDEEVAALLDDRQQRLAAKLRDQRAADRQRLVPAKETTPIVAFTKHPLYMPPHDAPVPVFSTVALNGISGRMRMATALDTLCRTVLLRLRVERRLQRAAKMLKASDKLQSFVEASQLSLVDVVSFLPSGEGTFALTNLPRPEPSPAQLDVFDVKELKVPLEYKRKAYTTLRFAEHPYSNIDGDDSSIRVLPAGIDEVPEVPVVVPQVDHFVQPLVTLEMFPTQPFSWVGVSPWDGVILGKAPQRISDGGAKPRHIDVNYAHITASLHRHVDVVREQLTVWPLPPPLREPQAEDELSDDDGEEAALPSTHPSGLAAIADWLPRQEAALVSPRVTAASTVQIPTVQTIGRCTVNADFTTSQQQLADWLSEVTEELPPTIPF
jgi:hypothetical protein